VKGVTTNSTKISRYRLADKHTGTRREPQKKRGGSRFRVKRLREGNGGVHEKKPFTIGRGKGQ